MGVAVPIISAVVGAGATVYSAKKQASTTNQTTRAQIDANKRAQELELLAQKEALDEQTKSNADQMAFLEKRWAQSQQNIAPYLGIGQGAATALSSFMGIPITAPQPAPMPTSPSSVSGTTQSGANSKYTDPTFVQGKINEGFQQLYGRDANPDEMSYWQSKMTTPDTFSDNKIRVGWNPYWQDRLLHPGSGSSSVAAGDDTVVGYQPPSPLVSRNLDSLSSFSSQGQNKPSQMSPLASANPTVGQGMVDDPLVWMMAPDGTVKRVRQSQVGMYESQGATVLQGGGRSMPRGVMAR